MRSFVYNTNAGDIVEQGLSGTQFAYHSGGSCTDASLNIQHGMYSHLDNPNRVAVRRFTMVYSRAFDSLSHKLLSDKLNCYIVGVKVQFFCIAITHVKTHKLLQTCKQVVTSLFTSCSQDVIALLVPNLLEQVWNKLLTNCNKLDGTIRPVTKLFQQD